MRYFLGLDIGGTNIKFGIGNSGQGVIAQAIHATHNADLSAFQSTIHKQIADFLAVHPFPISATGVGSPGTIDTLTGKLSGVNPNLKFWTDLDPLCILPESLGNYAWADNDANLMCLAESQGLNGIVLGLTIGTGIGGGLTINGEIFHGARGFALELGHSCIVPGGRYCQCGLQGCLEAYSSAGSIQRQVKEAMNLEVLPALADLIQQKDRVSHIAAVIEQGEELLLLALVNASLILDPDYIVLGGGAMDAGLYSLSNLQDKLKEKLGSHRREVQLKAARWGNQAGIMGAILIAEQRYSAITE